MLTMEEMVNCLARAMNVEPPPGPAGEWRFELADDMRLSLRPASGGRECIAWTNVLPPVAGASASDREARAARLLRLRLARLKRNPDLVAALEEDGSLVLYRRIAPESEREWLEAAARLLNEAEALHKLAEAERGGGSGPSLFAGLGNWLNRP